VRFYAARNGIRQGRRVRVTDLAHVSFGRCGVYERKVGGMLMVSFCGYSEVAQAWILRSCIVVSRHQVGVP
jgi:uncharacterized membrane protein